MTALYLVMFLTFCWELFTYLLQSLSSYVIRTINLCIDIGQLRGTECSLIFQVSLWVRTSSSNKDDEASLCLLLVGPSHLMWLDISSLSSSLSPPWHRWELKWLLDHSTHNWQCQNVCLFSETRAHVLGSVFYFYHHKNIWLAQMVKNLPSMQETQEGSIPGSRRSSGVGHGNPLQYSCLENPMDRGAWQTTVHGGHKESDTTEWLIHMHISKGNY